MSLANLIFDRQLVLGLKTLSLQRYFPRKSSWLQDSARHDEYVTRWSNVDLSTKENIKNAIIHALGSKDPSTGTVAGQVRNMSLKVRLSRLLLL